MDWGPTHHDNEEKMRREEVEKGNIPLPSLLYPPPLLVQSHNTKAGPSSREKEVGERAGSMSAPSKWVLMVFVHPGEDGCSPRLTARGDETTLRLDKDGKSSGAGSCRRCET